MGNLHVLDMRDYRLKCLLSICIMCLVLQLDSQQLSWQVGFPTPEPCYRYEEDGYYAIREISNLPTQASHVCTCHALLVKLSTRVCVCTCVCMCVLQS